MMAASNSNPAAAADHHGNLAAQHASISFAQRKKHILVELASATRDRSPKGFPDYPVLPILDCINEMTDYVTTR